MISNLIKILKDTEKLDAWNVKVVTKDVYELYFIKQNLEMNREVVTTDYYVTLFVNQNNKIGIAKFKLFSSSSNEEITKKINDQIENSKYSLYDKFSLPKKVDLKNVSKDVSFGNISLKDAAFLTADALFEADKFNNGYLNSSEIFIINEETKFIDSNGNNFQYVNQYGEVELVATWEEKGKEVEVYRYVDFDDFNSIFIQKAAEDILLEASQRIKAVPLPEINNCKVMLTKEYAKTYFKYIVDKLKNDNIYQKKSNYNIQDILQDSDDKCDFISIKLNPIMKDSTKGRSFDDDGIVLKRLNIIDKGIVKNFWGSNMYSQYLNRPVHGNYENFVVSAGSLSAEDLIEETYLEILALSDFDIDMVTGDFKSEIRLAILYTKGEKQIVTGGFISGNINDTFKTLRLSNDTIQLNNYIGPKNLLLDNITIGKGTN